MEERYICEKHLEHFRKHLIHEEKSQATIEKYMRDVGTFFAFLTGKKLEKERTIEYKHDLQERNYSIRSINSMLTALNHFLEFIGRHDCKVKMFRCQRQTYCPEEKELTLEEYQRLLDASKGDQRLNLVIQTI